MTAATLTRTRRSAFPTAVEDLIPLARDYAAELGTTPSRNQLMKRFKVGDKKAKDLLAALTPAPPVPDTEPHRPLIIVEDEGQKYFGEFLREASALKERGDVDQLPPVPIADTDRIPNPFAQYDGPPVPPFPLVDLNDSAVWGPSGERLAPVAETEPGTVTATGSRMSRYGMAALLTVVGILLAGVIIAPIALSSQDIIAWAASPTGLGLVGPWPLVTFFALDAAAAVCVGLVVYCAWRGESPGVFAWLVWAFAGMSAYANYSHSTGSIARDAVWFFPAMSLAGPFLLEIIVRRVRRWVQEGTGQRALHSVSFGFGRWIPGVGAMRETYGAWRLARLDGINDADQAVREYRQLCPTGSIRVLSALRTRDQH
jgi:hypothetical protein